MDHKFWVLIFDGNIWYSYAECSSHEDAKKAIKELSMEWEQTRIVLILE